MPQEINGELQWRRLAVRAAYLRKQFRRFDWVTSCGRTRKVPIAGKILRTERSVHVKWLICAG